MNDWRVSGFTEVRELGAGGQGRAVLVREDASGRLMVLKYVFAAADPETRAWFRQESALLKRVLSPYVARWFDHFEDESGSAILMEAIDGISLREVLAEHGSLDPMASLVVLKGSLLGLAAAHEVGVVHRDYKPSNVIVRGDGLSKLIDFGIAALSGGRGPRAGTPAYMAPEQWRDEPATPATDVYAATCVFFECVTGRRPYEADDVSALRAHHVESPIPVEEVPEPLRPLVAQGMAKDPAARLSGAAAFAEELEEAATRAYGPEWETRGVRILAMAGTALAALFPLAGLLSHGGPATTAGASGGMGTAGGAGSTGGAGTAGGTGSTGGVGSGGAAHGTGHTVRTVAGKGLRAKLGAKAAVVGTGVVVAAGAAGVYLSGTHHRPARTPTPTPAALARPVSVDVRTESRTFPGMPFVLDRARYVAVTGHRDPAIQQKINKALHRPIDRAIAEDRRVWSGLCKGHTDAVPDDHPLIKAPDGHPRISVSPRIVLRGPRILSVVYIVSMGVCMGGGGDAWTEAVDLDLATGRVFAQSDIFRPGVLTRRGIRALADRLPQSKPDGSGCGDLPLTMSYHGLVPAFSVALAADHVEITRQPGEACMGMFKVVKVPYSRLADLMNPRLLMLVGASAPGKGSPSASSPGRPSPANS